MNKKEFLPLVDETGQVTGCASRSSCHDGSKPLHPVVHLHVFDEAGRLFLQKRSSFSELEPGKWDASVGGHVLWEEDVETALRRETLEEIGLETFDPHFLARYIFESDREKELVHVYRTVHNGPFRLDPQELEDGRFFSFEAIEELIARELVTPGFAEEFRKIFLLPPVHSLPLTPPRFRQTGEVLYDPFDEAQVNATANRISFSEPSITADASLFSFE
jgi:isopentenyldiphosphate isomerase